MDGYLESNTSFKKCSHADAQEAIYNGTTRIKKCKKPMQISLLKSVQSYRAKTPDSGTTNKHKVLLQIGENCHRKRNQYQSGRTEQLLNIKCPYDWFKYIRERKKTMDDEPLMGWSSTHVMIDNIKQVRYGPHSSDLMPADFFCSLTSQES